MNDGAFLFSLIGLMEPPRFAPNPRRIRWRTPEETAQRRVEKEHRKKLRKISKASKKRNRH